MAVSALRERTARTESSRMKGTKRSRISFTGGNSDLALATSSAVRRIHWPLPSYPIREVFECSLIGVIGSDALGDAAHGSFGRRIEKTEMQTERVARESEHVAELSAAEDADGHACLPFFFAGGGAVEGSGLARTRPVCSARNLRKASRMARCFAPRMEAARSAALTAPDLPMASVPTGMPAGSCAMERSESRPLRARDSTGTPRTGRTVFEAVMPGRS